jgi:hypothetical protein
MTLIQHRPRLFLAALVLAGATVWPPLPAQAAILFGTDRFDGRLYRIDTTTLTTELMSSNLLVVPTGSSPNGNATDLARGVFYYAQFTPGRLFAHDLSTDTSADLGPLVGAVGSGAFHEGAFYYFTQITSSLRRVTFDPSGAVATNTQVFNPGIPYNFGDITIRADGLLYGWAELSPGNNEFFSVDLNNGFAFTLLATAQPGNLGLAFGDDGVLYGFRTDTQQLLQLDPATGSQTVLGTLDRNFSDLATGVAVPEPSALLLFGVATLGLLGFAGWRRRRA